MKLALIIFVFCLGLGGIEALQLLVGGGDLVETNVWIALVRAVPSWLILAGMSPVAVWASDRWPVRGERWHWSVTRHVGLAFPFSFLHLVLAGAWGAVRPGATIGGFTAALEWLVPRYFAYGMLSYGTLVGIVHAYRYHREAVVRNEEAHKLLQELETARRRAVEGKLHPHFVFNTLNAITGLAARGDQHGVVLTLAAFSELLQATLDDRVLEPVPLREEIELLESYVGIQKVRFGDRLRVCWDLDEAALGRPVPGLLLQPLVENALGHAIQRSRSGGTVTIRARVEGDGVRITVEDTGPDPDGEEPDGARPGVSGRGIGLDATRSRMVALFGERATLELSSRDGGGTRASAFIPRPA